METVTKEQIDTLAQLQEIEINADRIRAVLSELPLKLRGLEQTLMEFEKNLENNELALSELKKKYKENELAVQENLAMIKKSNGKLYSVKTNKEYQAILKEIDDIKKKSSAIEDEMLELIDKIDEQEKAIEGQKAEHEEIKEKINSEKKSVETESEKENLNLLELDTSKNEISEKIDPELLKIYTEIRKRINNNALAPVKDAVCQGCHMNIPPQMYNELHRRDTLKYCPHCNRIVYWKESETQTE